MTGQTVGGALAEQDESVGALVARYEASFAQVLPAHVPVQTFVRLAQGLLRRNEDLGKAAKENPSSLLAALLECARLGHEPGTDQYALTHFKNNRTNKPEIVGIEQYQGEIERMYRAGAVVSVKCEVVRAKDDFAWAPTRMRTPHHEYDALASDADRGELRGVYAYAELSGGALSQVVVMGKAEVMKHRAVAKTKVFWDGEWQPSMWKKTAIHELEKWVPTSSEYLRDRMRASAEASRLTPSEQGPVDTETGEIVDAELVDDDQVSA